MMITREIFLGLVSLPGIQLCGGSCVYVTKTVAKAAPTARISSKILSCLLAKLDLTRELSVYRLPVRALPPFIQRPPPKFPHHAYGPRVCCVIYFLSLNLITQQKTFGRQQ